MKIYNLRLFILFFLVQVIIYKAQSQPNNPNGTWKRQFQTGINYNQSGFSDSWKGGGLSTVSWNALLNAKAEYTDGRFFWGNDLQMQYGQTNTKSIGARKSFDRIFFESKASMKIAGNWNAFSALSFLSQFKDGFTYSKRSDGSDSTVLISAFMAPAYLTEAFGIEYKPAPYFSAQFGVASMRQTFVLNQDLYSSKYTNENKLYGVDKGSYLRNQLAFQFIGSFDKEVVKNITLKARYMMVVDYRHIDHRGLINRLDASIVAMVNKYITVNFGAVLLYDYSQIDDIQSSNVLGIGVLYSLSNIENKK